MIILDLNRESMMMTSQPIGLASSKIKEVIFVVEEDAE